jgi:hypothetical protein
MGQEPGPALKLPNMNEFARGTLDDLRPVLAIIKRLQPDRAAIVAEIQERVPKIAATPPGKSRRTRAANVLIGMSQQDPPPRGCGLYSKETNTLTAAGESLAAEPDEKRFYYKLAKHLLNYPGCKIGEILEAARLIQRRNEKPSLKKIREQLRALGFTNTHNAGDASKLRMWLEPSGVVDKNWNVNEELWAELCGITLSDASEFKRLTKPQQAFLKVLHGHANGGDWQATSHIIKLTELKFSRSIFPEGSLRARVFDPLVKGVWIEMRGKGPGRGGKSGDVKATPKLLAITAELETGSSAAGPSMIPLDLLDKEMVPLSKLYEDVESPDTGVKGLALELLAMRVARDLDLKPIKFHLRAASTGGAEVDLVAEGVLMTFSRWLFQCKAKGLGGITVSEVSKEVGLAEILGAQIIAMVTTGTIKGSVREFARRVAAATAKQVYLLDGKLLEQYRLLGPQRIMEEITRQAQDIQQAKRTQIETAKLEGLD